MLLRSLSIGLVALASSFSVTAQSTCSALLDHDQDGIVGVPDLMNLLSFFGGSVDDSPCTAQSTCSALLDHDQDGIVGVPDLMNLLSFFGGPADDSPCIEGPPECGGATTVTFDGYTYDLVAIGSQCWFAENLRTTHYANGDSIPGNLTGSEWTSSTTGATAVYGEGTSPVDAGSDDEVTNLENYGRLYNWYAVDDSRGLCPSGWHVPAAPELTVLGNNLGGSSVAGTAMKSSPADSPSWNGTNVSGFSALPNGSRGGSEGSEGNFNGQGYSVCFWSTATYISNPSYAWHRCLYSSEDDVNWWISTQRAGMAVRCVRDE